MRTLLERLKPEYLEVLENEVKNLYSQNYKNITKQLTENTCYGDLKFSDAFAIRLHLTNSEVELHNINIIFNK